MTDLKLFTYNGNQARLIAPYLYISALSCRNYYTTFRDFPLLIPAVL